MKKKILTVIMILAVTAAVLTGCGEGEASSAAEDTSSSSESSETSATSGEPEATGESGETESSAVESKGKIILATTTSTQDSGLLDYLLPVFTSETGWDVDTIAVGTGTAIQMGRDGEADVLLVHSREDEDKFVADGCAEKRYDVMYNDFVVIGPKDRGVVYGNDVEATFKAIVDNNLPFVSRGDDSGTHKKELAIWKKLGIDPTAGSVYISAGQGMVATIGLTNEFNAFTLSDRATWLTIKGSGLEIICEKGEDLLNPYGVIPVSKTVSGKINTEGGQAFADWITSPTTQALIGQFGVEQYGQPLFTPNAAAE